MDHVENSDRLRFDAIRSIWRFSAYGRALALCSLLLSFDAIRSMWWFSSLGRALTLCSLLLRFAPIRSIWWVFAPWESASAVFAFALI